ncbi:amino acid adenylation domain-containing protein [Streptomyces roseoverticillatus]|uniref:amino acid adenylation domain-containing protein n=1 Tax=Streptomyces roseoverticillatus TaxID=66429 RepID=UPI000A8930EB|nr:amino acid adenylation domain-containing protein [Streptomyces roseoverticillatus]
MHSAEPLAGARTLTDLFAGSVRLRPQAPALTENGRDTTYAELDRASDDIAALLADAGVGRGDLVGVLLERSHRMPGWIIGILKAGAAYVPLDPTYPRERLHYMVADARVKILVGDPEQAALCGLDGVRVIDPGTPAPAATPVGTPDPQDPAYVIYTSGSTGRPKGCVVTHANVLALLDAMLPLFDFGPRDRWSLFHSFSFDFSVWELWGPLATGGTAVVVPAAAARATEDFLRLLGAEGVTVLNQVPSVFRFLAREYADSGAPGLALRYVIFGGENVDLDVVRAFTEAAGERAPTFVNMYGVTETTVFTTGRTLTPEDLAGSVRSPIGVPLPHLSVELRDDALEAVADGEVGEMWVAGTGVTAGYLHRPDLTADRFRTSGGRRWYRTGDLARRLPDGALEYLGRNDQQVKIRGHRVELAEVEEALRAAAAVQDAAAAVTRDPDGTAMLVALVVAADGDAFSVAALRRHARATVPAQLVPNRFVRVDTLPLTPSGKLDRRAVQELADATSAPRQAPAGPRTRVLVVDPLHESALAELHRTYDVHVELRPSADRLLRLVEDAEVIVVRSGVRIGADVIRAAPRLKVVARAGSGVDNIDLDAAAAAGVTVFNIPGVSAPAVAELALGLMLSAARHIVLADRQVRAGVWNKAALAGAELGGKTLGLVGVGRIGSRLARLARGLDMRVVATVDRDTPQRRAELEDQGIELTSPEQLLATADVVCLAVPLTDRTHHLIDDEALRAMKRSALLVNISRGPVVDEEALYRALTDGEIAGAALDVVAEEGNPGRLAELDNVVITPHIGAMSADSQERIGRILLDSLREALAGRKVATACR